MDFRSLVDPGWGSSFALYQLWGLSNSVYLFVKRGCCANNTNITRLLRRLNEVMHIAQSPLYVPGILLNKWQILGQTAILKESTYCQRQSTIQGERSLTGVITESTIEAEKGTIHFSWGLRGIEESFRKKRYVLVGLDRTSTQEREKETA